MQAALATPVQQSNSATHPAVSLRRLSGALFVLFSAWMLWPMLFATHVEAFSARLQTMAMLDLRGQFVRDDLAYPIDLEYFYSTRGGTIHALEWIMRLTHTTGDLNFRILIWASFLIFVASSVVFVRRWSLQPVWAALAIVILIPGLTDISFFFADNLPSAAMVAVAMALLSRTTPPVTWFASGAALACGILFRTDAILAAPTLFLIALLDDDRRWQRTLFAWLSTLAGAAAVLIFAWHRTGVSLLQSLRVAKMYSAIHDSWGDIPSFPRQIALFFGPGILLIVLGALVRWKRSSRRERLILIVWPAILYVVFLFKAVELRDYLLLGAPFVLLLGATGLSRLLRLLEIGAPRQRRLAQAIIAVYLLTLFLPPMLTLHDGPRFTTGRIYAPPMWHRWQRTTDQAVQQLQSLADSTPSGGRTLILTTLFQSDRYLHLALLEDGYTQLPLRQDPSCGNVDTYVKGDRTLFHIRTENPYYLLSDPPLSLPTEYVRGYQLQSGFTCLPPQDYDRAYMVSWGRMWQGYLEQMASFHTSDFGPLEVPFPEFGTPHLGPTKYLQVQRVMSLTPARLQELLDRTQSLMHSYEQGDSGSWTPPHSYAEFHHQALPLLTRRPLTNP